MGFRFGLAGAFFGELELVVVAADTGPVCARFGRGMPCSSASCLRKEAVTALSSCLDSLGVNGTFGCAKILKLEASDAAGRSRRFGDGCTIVLCMGGVC